MGWVHDDSGEFRISQLCHTLPEIIFPCLCMHVCMHVCVYVLVIAQVCVFGYGSLVQTDL